MYYSAVTNIKGTTYIGFSIYECQTIQTSRGGISNLKKLSLVKNGVPFCTQRRNLATKLNEEIFSGRNRCSPFNSQVEEPDPSFLRVQRQSWLIKTLRSLLNSVLQIFEGFQQSQMRLQLLCQNQRAWSDAIPNLKTGL